MRSVLLSLKISVNQMPNHTHSSYVHMKTEAENTDAASGFSYVDNGAINSKMILSAGGGRTICPITGVATFGIVLHNLSSIWGGEI